MKKDIDKEVEICDCCEVHENLLQIVNETITEENELYDLAELFKVFGDSTRIRILFVLFEAEVLRVRPGKGIEHDSVSYFPPASYPETE